MIGLAPTGTLSLGFDLQNLSVVSPFGLSTFTIKKHSSSASLCVFPCQLCIKGVSEEQCLPPGSAQSKAGDLTEILRMCVKMGKKTGKIKERQMDDR